MDTNREISIGLSHSEISQLQCMAIQGMTATSADRLPINFAVAIIFRLYCS